MSNRHSHQPARVSRFPTTSNHVPAAHVSRFPATSKHVPATRVSTTSNNVPAARVSTTLKHVPAARVSTTSNHVPAARVSTTSKHVPAARVSTTSKHVPAARVSTTSNHVPTARVSTTSNHVPAARVSTTSKHVPAARVSRFPTTSSRVPAAAQVQAALHNTSILESVITGAGVLYKSLASVRRPKSYHEHSLISTNGGISLYKCSGCKELGMGNRYVCNDCSNDYILHPSCMYYEERATHKFFEGSTFEFHQKRLHSTNRICNACGSDIHGFFYHSAENSKDLHPCCLRLSESVLLEGRNFRLCKRLTSKCFHCGSRNTDDKDKCWCYSSKYLQSHVSCMKDAFFKC